MSPITEEKRSLHETKDASPKFVESGLDRSNSEWPLPQPETEADSVVVLPQVLSGAMSPVHKRKSVMPPSYADSAVYASNSDAINAAITQETPQSFTRAPQLHLSYEAFSPMYLIANGPFLNSGFPILPPPTSTQPHPFYSHDVTNTDWTRFLIDLKTCAMLSPSQHWAGTVIPLMLTMGITGTAASNSVKRSMKRKRQAHVGAIVDSWNHYFFHPRGIEIILARGLHQLSGKFTQCPVPDLKHERKRLHALRRIDATDDNDDDLAVEEAEEKTLPFIPLSRAELKAQRREYKRNMKIELREKKKEHKKVRKELKKDLTYRLYVVSLNSDEE